MACILQFVLVFFVKLHLQPRTVTASRGLAFLRHLPSPPNQATAYTPALAVMPLETEATQSDQKFVNCRVKKRVERGLDFFVDKLTNSIANRITGDSFTTTVLHLTRDDLKNVTKKAGWGFDWKYELNQPAREVYKLTISDNKNIIQGLASLEVKSDHIYMHLVESAPFNKGRDKVYTGVPGNLVPFACRLSFQRGFEGNISFISKTQLVKHYMETLGAFHAGGRLMIIETEAAKRLLDRYFKNIDI